MKNEKKYLALSTDGGFAFYDRTPEGLEKMAQMHTNHDRFFEITIEREVKLKFSVRACDRGEIPKDESHWSDDDNQA